jgi:hypothetical protein
MTLQLCVSPCALAGRERVVRAFPDRVVHGSPDPARAIPVVRRSPDLAHAATEGLPISTARTLPSPRSTDDFAPLGESPEFPEDDGDWEEFDPTPLESWILDDFDWDVEESYPERGDYWDDSLDREWDLARVAWKNSPNSPRDVIGGLTPPRSPSLSSSTRRRFAMQSLASPPRRMFPGGDWEQAS